MGRERRTGRRRRGDVAQAEVATQLAAQPVHNLPVYEILDEEGLETIHRASMQSAVFELLGIGREEAELKFGFLLEALRYGAPPHGGIAFGIDRIAALMAGTDSIRDVIAFPKTTSAQCLMTGAPSPIPDEQLAEVHVQVRPQG